MVLELWARMQATQGRPARPGCTAPRNCCERFAPCGHFRARGYYRQLVFPLCATLTSAARRPRALVVQALGEARATLARRCRGLSTEFKPFGGRARSFL